MLLHHNFFNEWNIADPSEACLSSFSFLCLPPCRNLLPSSPCASFLSMRVQYSYCVYMNGSKMDTTVLHPGPLLRSNTPICQLLTLAAMAHSYAPDSALLPAKDYLSMANDWLMQRCTSSAPLSQSGVTLKSHPSSRLHRMGWVLNFNHIGTWLCILLYFAFLTSSRTISAKWFAHSPPP